MRSFTLTLPCIYKVISDRLLTIKPHKIYPKTGERKFSQNAEKRGRCRERLDRFTVRNSNKMQTPLITTFGYELAPQQQSSARARPLAFNYGLKACSRNAVVDDKITVMKQADFSMFYIISSRHRLREKMELEVHQRATFKETSLERCDVI
uniref:Uncharacterized protein n=1 Tax=Ascaris lumbricoides TaxID=6252 RepID=A0A0M3HUE3_ASCLU